MFVIPFVVKKELDWTLRLGQQVITWFRKTKELKEHNSPENNFHVAINQMLEAKDSCERNIPTKIPKWDRI